MSPIIFAGLPSYCKINFLASQKEQIILNAKSDIERIAFTVFQHMGLDISYIFLKRRRRCYVEARQLSVYFIRNRTGAQWKTIGKFLGRDHSSAIYSYNTCCDLIQTNERFKRLAQEINQIV